MLENLMFLNLSFANFYGEIPHHLGNLSRLLRAQVVAGQVRSLKIGSCGVSLICAKIVGI